jgi:AcrR family transcriptional regulator
MTTKSARRPRPVLSRELIADTAMRLTLEQPTTTLTLARLGAELSADPTALYRHYRSRDELIRELADRLYGEIADVVIITDDWTESLRNAAGAIRSVMLRRPALAADIGTRFTGGANERRGSGILRDVLVRAGFSEPEVADHLRALGEMILSGVVMTATLLILPPEEQEFELSVAGALYGGEARDSLDYENRTFSWIFETYLEGLQARLRRTTHPREGVNMIDHERGEQ